MQDPATAKLYEQLARISADAVGQPVDWEARPGTSALGSDEDGHVEIELRGFEVIGVRLRPGWFEGAEAREVEAAVKAAANAALTALVDTELEAAMNTSYEQADVHARLIRLSAEAAGVMNERIRGLGESAL